MVSDIFGIWTKDIRAWLSVLHHWLQHTGTSWTLPHCTLFYMPLKDKYETDCYQDFFPNLILGSASVSLPSLVCFSLWDDLYISSCCCCWMHLTVQWAVYFVWVVFKIGRGESCSAIDHLLRVQIWRVREQVTQKKLCFADVAASEFALEFEQGECINWNCTYQDQKLICPENQNETVSRGCDTSFMKKNQSSVFSCLINSSLSLSPSKHFSIIFALRVSRQHIWEIFHFILIGHCGIK